jgi:hypothetical protein
LLLRWKRLGVRTCKIFLLCATKTMSIEAQMAVVRSSTFHILIFTSETTGPIATKLWWNGPWMTPFQKSVRSYVKSRSAVAAISVGCLKGQTQYWKGITQALGQLQPNFAEMVLGWPPSKNVYVISDLRPRWPPQPSLIYPRTIPPKFGCNWSSGL